MASKCFRVQKNMFLKLSCVHKIGAKKVAEEFLFFFLVSLYLISTREECRVKVLIFIV